jgi:hypothetical protein
LFLKPTILGGEKQRDDYEVLDANRKPIGRIMLHPQAPHGRPWFWGNNRTPNIPGMIAAMPRVASKRWRISKLRGYARPW